MPDYRSIAAQAARRHGLGDWFVRQIKQESGFDPSAASGAGARGIAQVVPRWHPDAPPASNPAGQLDWAANYMAGLVKKYGNVPQALSVYNSGKPDTYRDPGFAKGQTYRYVKSILSGSGGGAGPAAQTGLGFAPSGASASAPDITGAVLANLGSRLSPEEQLGNLVGALQAAPSSEPPAGLDAALADAGGKPMYAGKGMVKLASTANRAGVGLDPGVLEFTDAISGLYGAPLTIGTGTNHNRFVVGTNRESAHWTGRAADIPASGAALTRMGQDALIAAGMSPAEARKQQGGLFNLGRYQVIFNSHEGGNHFNHLHVGLR